MIIDAKGAILGRLGSYVAKRLLTGDKVDVVNAEECVISGNRLSILNEYIRRLHRKRPTEAPFFYRRPDFFVKRAIRGMLPFKRARGSAAFKNLKCHIGIPENLKKGDIINPGSRGKNSLHRVEFIRVKEICKSVGGRQ